MRYHPPLPMSPSPIRVIKNFIKEEKQEETKEI